MWLRQILLDFIELVVVCMTHPVLSHRDCFGIVCVTLPGVIPPIVGGVIPPETYAFYREVDSGIHACEKDPARVITII